MSKIYWEKHKLIYISLFIFAVTSLLVTGCRKDPQISDHYITILERWARRPWLSPDAKERVSLAIATYKNKTVDRKPILINAAIGNPVGSEEIMLYLDVLDEDEDILGFVIREELQDPNGTLTTIEESYPIFAHYPGVGLVLTYAFEISARNGEQRKAEKLWTDHLMNFDAQLKAEQIKPPPGSSGGWDWIDEYSEYSNRVFQLWRSSVPTMFISIPDPDKLIVWVHIYDRAGNVSNSVKLIDRRYLSD